MSTASAFAARIRARERAVGYWVALDAPVATERLARLGWDYVCLDGQHGLIGYQGLVQGLMAIDAGATAAGLVRTESSDLAVVGRALDAGAAGVIAPLVDDAETAAAVVSACRYPPRGRRSYGPGRANLRIGPEPVEVDETVLAIVMIETAQGLANVEEIAATPGLDGVYVGPSDLSMALGGARPMDPAIAEDFEAALARVRAAAESAGIAAGMHTPDGAVAARRLGEGFTFATVAMDLAHLERASADHLAAARAAA